MNTSRRRNSMLFILEEGIKAVTAELWMKRIGRPIVVEDKMCNLYNIIDDIQESIIINPNESDSESSATF